MDDWIKIAKDLEYKDEKKKRTETRKERALEKEMLESEKNWIERVTRRVDEIADRGIRIRIEKRPNGLELICKGSADIQFVSHGNFLIKYHNVFKSTNRMAARAITVLHHRQVRVRQLNAHNIEEVLKFAALGFDNYSQVAAHERIEHNLQDILESNNLEEHIDNTDRI